MLKSVFQPNNEKDFLNNASTKFTSGKCEYKVENILVDNAFYHSAKTYKQKSGKSISATLKTSQ